MSAQASLRYTLTSDGVDIAYTIVGSGDPVVVAGSIAGAGIDVSVASKPFMARYQPLTMHHSVVLFDWRNMGASGSSSAPLSMDTFLADLSAVVDAVGNPQVDLIGQAAPAHAAVHYAAAHPARVRRLAVVGFQPAGNSFRTNPRLALLWPLVESDWDAYARSFAVTMHGLVDAGLARATYTRLSTRFNPELWKRVEAVISTFRSEEERAPRWRCRSFCMRPPG